MVQWVKSLVAASMLTLVSAGALAAQETSTKEERPKIRVLNQPGDISSFYRRGSSPYRYRFVPRPAPEENSFPYPTPRHPLSGFYRSTESFVEPIFDPPGYVPYPDRALVYRVYRPGFFLGGFAGSCPCGCGRN